MACHPVQVPLERFAGMTHDRGRLHHLVTQLKTGLSDHLVLIRLEQKNELRIARELRPGELFKEHIGIALRIIGRNETFQDRSRRGSGKPEGLERETVLAVEADIEEGKKDSKASDGRGHDDARKAAEVHRKVIGEVKAAPQKPAYHIRHERDAAEYEPRRQESEKESEQAQHFSKCHPQEELEALEKQGLEDGHDEDRAETQGGGDQAAKRRKRVEKRDKIACEDAGQNTESEQDEKVLERPIHIGLSHIG